MREVRPNEEGRCVVLADSHHEALEGIRGLLEVAFDAVVMLVDKRSLFETISKMQPELVVVDLALRPAGEIDIARELREFDPDVKFIILSVHDDPSIAESVVESGASGFVFKPSVGTDLLLAVRAARKGRVYISPRVRQGQKKMS